MPQTDAFGKHEVLHTASIIMSMWEHFILDHEATKLDPEVSAAAQNAFEAIHDFYQACGRKFL